MVTARDIKDLLDERPDLEPAVESVLEPEEPWAFEDIDVDSGAFGELVSHDVVTQTDDGYVVADREATRQALAGQVSEQADEQSPSFEISLPSLPNTRVLAALAGALAIVFALRVTTFPAVFQGEVVLTANDPYYYRYWVERMLTDPETTLTTVPDGIAKGEPLLVATLWLVSSLLGGTKAVAGQVLAWYPVVSALVTGVFVYLLTVEVTDDRRVGIAAVVFMGTVAGHGLRTSLGFADHHAFDYLWLLLTALGATIVVRDAIDERPLVSTRTLTATTAVTVGVAAQALAWDAGPLLLVPLGVLLAADAVVGVSTDRDPFWSGGPLVLATALAAGLVWVAHTAFGWHTTLVAISPALLTAGGLGVVLAGTLSHRFDVPMPALAGVTIVGVIGGTIAFSTLAPTLWTRVEQSLDTRLFRTDAIAETTGLFGESGGWLLLIGLLLFVGVPYLLWATYRVRDDSRWLVPVVYTWYFFALAAVQVRFVGQLGPFLGIFGGLAFVHFTERVDVARQPTPFGGDPVRNIGTPDRQTVFAVGALFVLLGAFGAVQVPLKSAQLIHTQEQYETTSWMNDHAETHDLEYPQNYVFSAWGANRHYNYFVNGESRSYGYARTNYESFISATDSSAWYNRLTNRAGYVVVTPTVVGNDSQLGTRLYREHGSRANGTAGLAHYRLGYVSSDEQYKVFTLVPGAVLQGTATPNATVTVETTVEIEGASFTYTRQTTAQPSGTYTLRVAYPGTYRVPNGTVTVNESAVRNGTTVTVTTAS
ncbi:STT3 domain-containing protein [Halobaculum gomorrense]|uniref:dolichyl-phosphooligosaccharide-protein glycotransferase n=1 Tax=Halobaculum gomorrense TaxID=43928 RepID=A0A1M5UZ37_9EURY|nr:STT3 domain-containing protein [Halobaculum gomorrense]SHH68118.1 dolichyl-diphosphooligosaccharide--protein glycosyltransferase [Halobaculum gomorrense]